MEHFVEKPPPTRRSSSEDISKPKLAGVLGKYKLPITKLKRAGRGILYLFIQKILKIPSHFGVENFRNR